MPSRCRADAPRQVLDSLRTQRLTAVFLAGWLLLDFPLLALWNREATVFGLPLLPVALFAVWAALIALAGWITERPDD